MANTLQCSLIEFDLICTHIVIIILYAVGSTPAKVTQKCCTLEVKQIIKSKNDNIAPRLMNELIVRTMI